MEVLRLADGHLDMAAFKFQVPGGGAVKGVGRAQGHIEESVQLSRAVQYQNRYQNALKRTLTNHLVIHP
jgi:hypothetical protein